MNPSVSYAARAKIRITHPSEKRTQSTPAAVNDQTKVTGKFIHFFPFSLISLKIRKKNFYRKIGFFIINF